MDGAIQPQTRGELDHEPDVLPNLESLPRNLRLTDAERIALDRLKDAPTGSLKEALATTIVAVPPEVSSSLSERLADIAPPDEFLTLMPFQAAPGSLAGWMDDAVPPAHTFEMSDDDTARPSDLTAKVEPPVLPEAFVSVLPPEDEAADDVGDVRETHAQELALRLLAPEHADAMEPVAPGLAGEGARKAEEVIGRVSATTVASLEARVRQEFGLQASDPQLDPIVSAFAANARLAADATAAVEALHHLKKLLVDKLAEEPSGAPDATTAEAVGRAEDSPASVPVADEAVVPSPPAPTETAPDVERDSIQSPPVPVVAAVTAAVPAAASAVSGLPLEPPPEELPHIVSRVRAAPAIAPVPAAEPVRTPPAPPEPIVIRSVEAERPRAASSGLPVRVEAPVSRRSNEIALPQVSPHRSLPAVMARPMSEPRPSFDLRGFVAGFMLSGAIGLLLYFVMVLTS